MVNKFVGSTIYNVIKSVKPNVPDTKIGKKIRDLKLETQKLKGAGKKLDQTAFEIKNKLPITFKKSTKKTESNKEAYKRIQGENTKAIKSMIDDAFKEKKAKGGRVGLKRGTGLKRKSNVQKIKETFGPKQKPQSRMTGKKKKFPDMSGDGKITKKDILIARGVIPKPKKKVI